MSHGAESGGNGNGADAPERNGGLAGLLAKHRRDDGRLADLLDGFLTDDTFTYSEVAAQAGMSIGALRKRLTEAGWNTLLEQVASLPTKRGAPVKVWRLSPGQRNAVEQALATVEARLEQRQGQCDPIPLSEHPGLDAALILLDSVYDGTERSMAERLQRIDAAGLSLQSARAEYEALVAQGTHEMEAALTAAFRRGLEVLEKRTSAVASECAGFLASVAVVRAELGALKGKALAEAVEERLFEDTDAAQAVLLLERRQKQMAEALVTVVDGDTTSFAEETAAMLVAVLETGAELSLMSSTDTEAWSALGRELLDALEGTPELCMEAPVAETCGRLAGRRGIGECMVAVLRGIAEGASAREDDLAPANAALDLLAA